jgi:hypothetical protein
MPAVTLEAEEWYVLENWLRERENRLMYALRPKSGEWTFVHDLRRTVEREGAATEAKTTAEPAEADEATKAPETAGTTRTVALSDRQVTYLSSFLRRRARKLLLFPWRSRERRDVRHLRDHLLAEVERSDGAAAWSVACGRQRD